MNDDQCQKIPLRSRLAHGVWRTLLNSPAGSWVEQALVWSGHLSPHQSWPGQGAAVGEISRMRAGQSLIATLVGGVQIVVPAIPEGVALYIKGRYVEEGTVQLFHRFWKPGQVFFDVGANMGLFTFLGAKACGSTGQVYAFEPQVNLVRYLERSVALNECGHTVTIVGAAVSSDHSTHATLYYAANREKMRAQQAEYYARTRPVSVWDDAQVPPITLPPIDPERHIEAFKAAMESFL